MASSYGDACAKDRFPWRPCGLIREKSLTLEVTESTRQVDTDGGVGEKVCKKRHLDKDSQPKRLKATREGFRMAANTEQQRMRGMSGAQWILETWGLRLEPLQGQEGAHGKVGRLAFSRQDPEITQIVTYSKFVAAWAAISLQEVFSGGVLPAAGWRKSRMA